MTDTVVGVEIELKTMEAIVEALRPIASDGAVVARVLNWAMARYSVEVAPPQRGGGPDSNGGPDKETGHTRYTSFDELFDAANPGGAPEKALVAGYWFQVVKGLESFDSFQPSRELKNHGHQSSNITRDLGNLIERQPRLVIQVEKHGSTRQGRKKYKLTREGIKRVEQMLKGDAE